jgi:hypothetical protein
LLFLLITTAEAAAVAARLRMNFPAADWTVSMETEPDLFGLYRVAVLPVALAVLVADSPT